MKILDYEIDTNDIFVGIGHRAKQGKDTVADFMKELLDEYTTEINFYKMYLVEDLLTELRNPLPNKYLFHQLMFGYDIYYEVADSICKENPDRYIYKIYSKYEVPLLHKIFSDRNIVSYYGMSYDINKKDSQIMQFWGEYRRKQDKNIWIKKTLKKIQDIQQSNYEQKMFVFTNLRFFNEYSMLRDLNGTYLKVNRLNDDNSLYTDQSRDPNHISETELINVTPDYIIESKSGDFESIKTQTKQFLDFKNLIEQNDLYNKYIKTT